MAGRVSNVAPVGSLLKGAGRETRSKPVKAKARAHDNAHLEAIRQLPCLNPACRRDPAGVAAHVRFACAEARKPITGMQTKPDDAHTVPLCQACHADAPDAQHKGSEVAFWNRLGVDPLKISAALYDASPNVEHMRSIVFVSHTISAMEG
ncbi:MAG: hypothetical protein WC807_14715 [Hyphomicrobium sp.]|jgi:hypothetical protein